MACDLELFVQDIWVKVDGSFCLDLIKIWSHHGYSIIHVLLICRLTHKLINIFQYWFPDSLVFMVYPDERIRF